MDQNTILMNYNFRISFSSGEFRASAVRSIEQAVELEYVREGGCNGYVHSLVKPPTEPKRLVIERGFCSKDSLKIGELLGIPQKQPLLIAVYDRTGKTICHTYQIDGWTLVKWKLSDLDAIEGKVLLETAEIVYEIMRDGKS
ncbi:MAG: hypothetical protein HFG18_04830 [Oscillospiraceae bacterium]|nr:hypothetical protein [Oscillospiraceae bacterium]